MNFIRSVPTATVEKYEFRKELSPISLFEYVQRRLIRLLDYVDQHIQVG